MKVQKLIDQARQIIDSLDDSAPETIGYDEATYRSPHTLTREQIQTIASALYSADCAIHELTAKKIKDVSRHVPRRRGKIEEA